MSFASFDIVFEKFSEKVRNFEGEKRFAHTLAVIKETEYLCDAVLLEGEDKDKALTAALFHDITKSFSDEEQKNLVVKYGIDDDFVPSTVHEKTGAYFAREMLGKETVDDTVFSAISCHTTASTDMSITDMILFIADFTEETRKYENCIAVREYLHTECGKINCDQAKAGIILRDVVLKIIKSTLEHLISIGERIDLKTVKAWNSMVQ